MSHADVSSPKGKRKAGSDAEEERGPSVRPRKKSKETEDGGQQLQVLDDELLPSHGHDNSSAADADSPRSFKTSWQSGAVQSARRACLRRPTHDFHETFHNSEIHLVFPPQRQILRLHFDFQPTLTTPARGHRKRSSLPLTCLLT